MKKIAVLLLNLGGPDSLADIRGFLTNLFLDREIIRLPMQPVLARIIAASRAKKVAPRYEAIGGRSPIKELTSKQAKALEEALKDILPDVEFQVFYAMRYTEPFIVEKLNDIMHDTNTFDRIVILPLFPQYSKTTTGSCFKLIRQDVTGEEKWHRKSVDIVYVDKWYDNEQYLAALADKIKLGLSSFKGLTDEEIIVIFSAHSIPQQFIDEGDPYKKQVEDTVGKLLKLVTVRNWRVTYQSRSGPVKWLEPNTEDVLKDLAAKEQKGILVVPVSFVSDHVETLYEIDIMYKNMCQSLGVEQFIRSESLNDDPKFIEALADVVTNALQEVK